MFYLIYTLHLFHTLNVYLLAFTYISMYIFLPRMNRHRGPQQEPVQAVPGVHTYPDLCGAARAPNRTVIGGQHLTFITFQVVCLLH